MENLKREMSHIEKLEKLLLKYFLRQAGDVEEGFKKDVEEFNRER